MCNYKDSKDPKILFSRISSPVFINARKSDGEDKKQRVSLSNEILENYFY